MTDPDPNALDSAYNLNKESYMPYIPFALPDWRSERHLMCNGFKAAQPPNKYTEKVRRLYIKYTYRKIKEGKMPELASLLPMFEKEMKKIDETTV